MPSAESTSRRPVLTVLLSSVILGLVLLDAYAYCERSKNTLQTGIPAVSAATVARQSQGLLRWAAHESYYPPAYTAYLSLMPRSGPGISIPWLVLWSDLLLALGVACTAGAMWRWGAGTPALLLALALLAGGPLFAAHAKLLCYEVGMTGPIGVCLLALAGPRGPRGRWSWAVAGAAAGAALLFKWTSVFHLIGPVMVAVPRGEASGVSEQETRVRLGIAAALALAIAGPWYLFCLDWHQLAVTAANDPNVPLGTPFGPYRHQLYAYFSELADGSGALLWPLVLVGLGLGLVRRTPGSEAFFTSGCVPLAFLPAFHHAEARYLVPALPSLMAVAGSGLAAGLAEGWWIVLVLVGVFGARQVGECTWRHHWYGQRNSVPGPAIAYDENYRMLWPSRSGQAAHDWIVRLTRELPGAKALAYGVHPLVLNPGASDSLMAYLAMESRERGEKLEYMGYDWAHYRAFVEDLVSNRIGFLVLDEGAIRASLAVLHNVTDKAWVYVLQSGPKLPTPPRPPRDDPAMLRRIRADYGVVASFADPQGEVFLLVRKDLWARAGRKVLPPLPEASDWPSNGP